MSKIDSTITQMIKNINQMNSQQDQRKQSFYQFMKTYETSYNDQENERQDCLLLKDVRSQKNVQIYIQSSVDEFDKHENIQLQNLHKQIKRRNLSEQDRQIYIIGMALNVEDQIKEIGQKRTQLKLQVKLEIEQLQVLQKKYYDIVYKYFQSIKSQSKSNYPQIQIITKENENESTGSPFRLYESFRKVRNDKDKILPDQYTQEIRQIIRFYQTLMNQASTPCVSNDGNLYKLKNIRPIGIGRGILSKYILEIKMKQLIIKNQIDRDKQLLQQIKNLKRQQIYKYQNIIN